MTAVAIDKAARRIELRRGIGMIRKRQLTHYLFKTSVETLLLLSLQRPANRKVSRQCEQSSSRDDA